MDNQKADDYYLRKIVTDLKFILAHTEGLRNRIVHEYGKVDLSIVHDTVQKDIPELLRTLEQAE